MGEARDVMDRLAAAVIANELPAIADCYAEDAVLVTPGGEFRGREAIIRSYKDQVEAYSDGGAEIVRKHEAGNAAIDEAYITGTLTGPLRMPSGEVLAATGKRMRIRSCDVAIIEDGLVVEHHVYLDQLDAGVQLGLLPEPKRS